MREFYFIRHGQTDANLQGIMCGGMWDLEVNSTGLEQARVACEKFRPLVPSLEAIYVSPLKRTHQTASFFVDAYKIQPTVIEELREWKIGEWERVSFHSIKDEFLGKGEPPAGESRSDFESRVKKAFELCSSKGPALLVSHGGVGLALQKYLGTDVTRIENCVPYHVFQTANGKWNTFALE